MFYRKQVAATVMGISSWTMQAAERQVFSEIDPFRPHRRWSLEAPWLSTSKTPRRQHRTDHGSEGYQCGTASARARSGLCDPASGLYDV